MTTTRQEFLDRVRSAVAAGNRAGEAAPLEDRGNLGYQGAGNDPLTRFCEQLRLTGGCPYPVADRDEARAIVLKLVQERSPRHVLVGRGPWVDVLELPEALPALDAEVTMVDAVSSSQARETYFRADIGISGVDYLLGETGSLVVLARPDQPRSVSLLPPVHIVVAGVEQIIPDLFDLFERIEGLPSCLTIITGPSKTGDIELRLVTGVHGPGEVHVVIITGPNR